MNISMLHVLLGEELLASLLGITRQDLRRHVVSPHTLTGQTTDRLNLLSAICHNLQGSYTRDGIRGWFVRERYQLKNKRPIDILKGDWWPRDPDILLVLELSASLRER
ncbi:hypothetical protein KGO95_02995 [Patescibacteria group bacterium]|nr:hypothetical protein [Patescibacteria group bacterium]